jgi:hypothetical protein
VALISSLNEDGETNLVPISSFWTLGWTTELGLLDETETADNVRANQRDGGVHLHHGQPPAGGCDGVAFSRTSNASSSAWKVLRS